MEKDILSSCSILSSVMILIEILIASNSCIRSFKEYGTSTMLKFRPNLLIVSTCILLSNDPEYLIGPSAIGLKKTFFAGL